MSARRSAPDGTITEWEFHNYNSGASGLQSPYAIAKKKEQYHPSKSPLRQGSYRGLAATANHFVRESYMDELAHSVEDGPAGVPAEEREGRAAAQRDRGGGRQVRLEGPQEGAGPGLRHRRRVREGRLRGDLRGGRRSRTAS